MVVFFSKQGEQDIINISGLFGSQEHKHKHLGSTTTSSDNLSSFVWSYVEHHGLLENSYNQVLQGLFLTVILFVFAFLVGWSLLPNALRPFKIYCAPPNLGIRT